MAGGPPRLIVARCRVVWKGISSEYSPLSDLQSEKGTHGRRLWTIEGHQERKLPVGEFEWTQCFVETAGQCASRALYMKTETTVAHHNCCIERERIFT